MQYLLAPFIIAESGLGIKREKLDV